MSVKSFKTSNIKIEPGKVVQIVYARTETGTTSSSSTYADTTLTATITPTSASNKVLVMVNHNGCEKTTNDTSIGMRLFRGATNINQIVVDAGKTSTSTRNQFNSISINILDEPATTSATTYKTQFNSQGNNATTVVQQNNSSSTIVLMEVTP